MPFADSGSPVRKQVVVYPVREHVPDHESTVQHEIARRIAALQAMDYGGDFDPARDYGTPLYYLPTDTLVGLDLASSLGIASETDLFGAVVAHPFVSTKAITHDIVADDARAPHGWSSAFCQAIKGAVLEGHTAFSLADARRAGQLLLTRGPVRIKCVRGTAGRGQSVAGNARALAEALDEQDPAIVERDGLVLERHLEDVVTYSVGHVRVAGMAVSYVGTQCLTRANDNVLVYGGSELLVWRGELDRAPALDLDAGCLLAIEQAHCYDANACAHFDGLLASRRNYDVVAGTLPDGGRASGVLEQSWRVGGASSAEIAAIEAFAASPTLQAARARSVERYGANVPVPAGARILYSGVDDRVGAITKYSMVEPL